MMTFAIAVAKKSTIIAAYAASARPPGLPFRPVCTYASAVSTGWQSEQRDEG